MQYFLLRLPLTLIEEEGFSHILICKNMEIAKIHLEERYIHSIHHFFEKDEVVLDDAKELIREAYIAEARYKYLIVLAKSYRIEAQNALLKILEEPPRNIAFILVAPSKTTFLPTVRSRMVVQELKSTYEKVSTGLDLKRLEVGHIYTFVQENMGLDKNALKETVQSIVVEAIKEHKLHFTEQELSYFQKLVHLAELNSRPQTLLTALLLAILQRKYR